MRSIAWMTFAVLLLGCGPASLKHADVADRPDQALAMDATAPLVASSRAWLAGRDCALSCHTTHAFVLASRHLGPQAEPVRDAILDKVAGRVEHWSDAVPWYAGSPDKAAESRGTESVLNAFALTTQGHPAASQAIAHLAAAQRADGGWDWLDFGLAPWEDDQAEVAGAALAAVALARADNPPSAVVEGVRGYLRRRSDTSNIHNAIALLWSDAELGTTIPCKRRALLREKVRKQQRRDGSWAHDPYLTAFATFVLGAGGTDPDGAAARGRSWLRRHQHSSGHWQSRSPNSGDAFNQQLATDAATAFAVLALGQPASGTRSPEGESCPLPSP